MTTNASIRVLCRRTLLIAALALPGCMGAVGDFGARAGDRRGADNPPGPGEPRFRCDDASLRGQGESSIRRLSRGELEGTLRATLGAVMERPVVREAMTLVPPDSSVDLVHEFRVDPQEADVAGLMALSESIIDALEADAALRTNIFGTCAENADRSCANAFLEGKATQLLRRPIEPERRDALLSAFDRAGQGRVGMERILAILLQAPELAFHLDVLELDCERAQDASFAWNDSAASWNASAPVQTLTAGGWFVWQLEGARIPNDVARLTLRVVAPESATAARININANDARLIHGVVLTPGVNLVETSLTSVAGAPLKIGVQFLNPDAGPLSIEALTLGSATGSCAASEAVAAVDAWTVASRLSFALTGAGPDQELLDAARDGRLANLEQARAQAERLSLSPAARSQFGRLIDWWMHLSRVPDPNANVARANGIEAAGLGAEASAELVEYATHVVFDEDGDVTSLLSANIGFPRSERMSRLYGSDIASGAAPVELPEGYGGLLTRIAPMLAGNLTSSPILRGVYVIKTMLCGDVGSPSAAAVDDGRDAIAALDPTRFSNREIVNQVTSSGPCPACHIRINAIGFSLESFDSLGRLRDEETVYDEQGVVVARHPIDAEVDTLYLEPGGPTRASSARELNEAIAATDSVRACVAERLYTTSRFRSLMPEDDCAMADVEGSLRAGESIRSAWISSIVNPELFLSSTQEQ